MTTKIWAGGAEIPLNPFVATLVGNVVKGIVSALKGISGAPERIELQMHQHAVTRLEVNYQPVSLQMASGFAQRIISSTLAGMLAPLKGAESAAEVIIRVLEE